MPHLRSLLLALAALVGVVLFAPAAAPAASWKAKVGIADQKATALADPRIAGLGVRHVRRTVAWDALRSRWQTEELDAWIAAAQAARLEPLVTFSRSRVLGRARALPTLAQYRTAVRGFRARYPAVRTFSAWNEANFCGELTCRKPKLVAGFYRALKQSCPGCKVLAADLLDLPNAPAWIKAFTRAARVQPRLWGLHNYVSANRFDPRPTRRILAATRRGELWLTETGGLVARRNGSALRLPQGERHAAKVTRFIFDRLARLSPRVSRVYLYHWRSTSRSDRWDSALIGPDGGPRPAYGVLRGILRAR
jgi:hypothetical protein